MASFATTADLQLYAVNPKAFETISVSTQQAQLDAASTFGEGYLAAQFKLPIVAPFPIDLKQAVCNIAAYWLMGFRGYQPDGGADMEVRRRYEDALAWFKGIAAGIITPAGIIDSAPSAKEGAPIVTTGLLGNVVGGNATPTTLGVGGARPNPITGTIPGRRGW